MQDLRLGNQDKGFGIKGTGCGCRIRDARTVLRNAEIGVWVELLTEVGVRFKVKI